MGQDSPAYKRILLKLSGEALLGRQEYGIDPPVIQRVAAEIAEVRRAGVEVGLVIGGGNIFRGAGLAEAGMDRVTGDQMGMLGTVINALAMQDALERHGEVRRAGVEVGLVIGGGNIFRGAGLAEAGMDRVTGDQMGMLGTVINALAMQDALERHGEVARVMSALQINEVCEDYIRRRAIRHLEKGRVVIFAAGTGNPFFTTDTAASLRAIEISADIMIKATKVDGVYSADPFESPDAVKYDGLTFDQVLADNLRVMDATAIVMCRENNLPLIVFNLNNAGDLVRIVNGETLGTEVSNEKATKTGTHDD